MSEWNETENDDVEIVDIESDTGDTNDGIKETGGTSSEELQPKSEWWELSDEEMQRRGDELGKRLELQSSLRQMRLDDLQNGKYNTDLLAPGTPLDLDDDETASPVKEIQDVEPANEETHELTSPSEIDRLKAFRDLVVERDPETCAILERMNESSDDTDGEFDPPQKVLKRR